MAERVPRMVTAFDTPEQSASLERWYMAGLVCMALLVGAFPLYRWHEPARRAVALTEQRASYARAGHELYAVHCFGCHGIEARGGMSAPTLAAKEFLKATDDAQMRWLIGGGVPGTTMVAYSLDFGGPLTAQQIDQVVTFLRGLEPTASSVPDWRTSGRAPEPPPVAPQPVKPLQPITARADSAPAAVAPSVDIADQGTPTAAMVANGKKYYTATCVACHGAEGKGSMLGPTLKAKEFLASRTDAQMQDVISKGVKATTMVAWAKSNGGVLDDAIIRDIIAYIRSWTPTAKSIPDWKTRRPLP